MKNNCEQCESQDLQPETSDSNSTLSLSKERVIFVSEDFTDEMANNFAAILIAYANIDPDKEVTILIDSNGGSITSFVLMHDIIELVGVPIKTICLSNASSAAAMLLSSGDKGKRFALPNSLIMIHGLQCLFPFGGYDVKSSDQYLDVLDYYNDLIMQILSDNTGKDFEQVKEDCKKDFFLTPEEAIKYGIIDGIVTSFDEIINIKESVTLREIEEDLAMQESVREELVKELDLKCDAKCQTCPKVDGCQDLIRINTYLASKG